MTTNQAVHKDAETRMQGALDTLGREFAGVRTGRASAALVESVRVDYYDTPTPIPQVASVSVPDPRTLRRRDVVRWLTLLQFSDLMLDVLHGFLALYFVDVVGLSGGGAALAILVWTGIGLLGDAAMIPLLERVEGVRYVRASAAATSTPSRSPAAVRRTPSPSTSASTEPGPAPSARRMPISRVRSETSREIVP